MSRSRFVSELSEEVPFDCRLTAEKWTNCGKYEYSCEKGDLVTLLVVYLEVSRRLLLSSLWTKAAVALVPRKPAPEQCSLRAGVAAGAEGVDQLPRLRHEHHGDVAPL